MRTVPDNEAASADEPNNRVHPQPTPAIPDHELLKKIGGGSYGEVWLARNIMGTLRAVKIVSRRDFSEAYPFEREFKGIQKYEPVSRTHDGLIDILQIGRNEKEGYFYYVMELADDSNAKCKVQSAECGVQNDESSSPPPSSTPHSALSDPHSYVPRTLRSDLKGRGRLSPTECIHIASVLSSALEHLHQNGLVHRDIKPSNIIFVNGSPKLADNGLVADVDEARSFVGTVGFIAPEGPGSPRADVYSLGKVLYEVLTGKDRQEFPALPEDFQKTNNADLKELNQVILQACESDQRLRYPSAQAIHDDLARVSQGLPMKPLRAWQRRLKVTAGIGLAVLVVASIIGLVAAKTRFQRRAPKPEAVTFYDLGRWYYQQLTDESLKKAIKYLDQAIQIDPEYVPPYTVLVGMYTWKVPGMSEEEKGHKIKQIATKLLHLDPKLAEGHVAFAYSKYLEGDWRKAVEEIERAVRLNPNYAQAHVFACYLFSLLGMVEEAKAHGERAQQLDSTSRIAATIAGYPWVVEHRYDEAISQFSKALDLDQHFALAHRWTAKAREAKGEYLAALDEFQKTAISSGLEEDKARKRFDKIREGYLRNGRRGYWEKVLELVVEMEASHEEATVADQDRWSLDCVYAQLGETNKALDILDSDFHGGPDDSWLKLEPLYDPLRNEPRFKALLKRAGLEK